MSDYKDIKDIYDVLDSLRKRPGLCLEYNTGSKFSSLITFINALAFSSFGDGTPSFWEFNRWMTGRVDGMSKTLPWRWMQSEWGNDKAFEMFFELLDEYRACTDVYLCRAIIRREHKPNFYRVNSEGERVEPEKPLELCAAQFAPSSVYYLLEVYTNRHDRSFPYHKSVDVKKEALISWTVPEDEWFDI